MKKEEAEERALELLELVGLTEKIDVVESLEKRIQSRFSHRQIFIPPISFENKLDVIKSRLLLSQAFMNNQDNISNNNNNKFFPPPGLRNEKTGGKPRQIKSFPPLVCAS